MSCQIVPMPVGSLCRYTEISNNLAGRLGKATGYCVCVCGGGGGGGGGKSQDVTWKCYDKSKLWLLIKLHRCLTYADMSVLDVQAVIDLQQ